MTDEIPQARREDYWESVEASQQTVTESIIENAGEWDILAILAAGQDGTTLFCTVFRRKVSDSGNLILSERYYRYDTEESEGSWLSNGIERRISGSLATALKVVYSAVGNGDLSPDSPMLIDGQGDGLEYNPASLTEPPETQADAQESQEIDSDTGAVGDDEHRCMKCEQTAPESELSCLSGDLGDLWVHSDGCPEGDA